MVFSIDNFPKPTREEYEVVKRIAKFNPDDIDSRELWVLENFAEGDEDD